VALTGKQRRHLRALGHSLRPVVQVGRTGASEEVVSACDQALADHELIKVKIGQGADDGRHDIADALAAGAGAEVAQVLGRTVLLYRPRAEGDERPRIKLP
jgi:RNA-binding protein